MTFPREIQSGRLTILGRATGSPYKSSTYQWGEGFRGHGQVSAADGWSRVLDCSRAPPWHGEWGRFPSVDKGLRRTVGVVEGRPKRSCVSGEKVFWATAHCPRSRRRIEPRLLLPSKCGRGLVVGGEKLLSATTATLGRAIRFEAGFRRAGRRIRLLSGVRGQ